jgi:microcystin-dependent protein
MSEPYVGEIRMFGFGRVPTGWFACDGTVKSIAQYEVLFILLGTTYGGDGVNTFGVPDMRGAVPIHQGQGPGMTMRPLGQRGGTEAVTLTTQQMPIHTHALVATSVAASMDTPSSTALPGAVSGETFYVSDVGTGATAVPMEPAAVSISGGNQPHENCMPTLTVQYCIAWSGIFPQQS